MAMDSQTLENSRRRPRIAAVILNWNGEGLMRKYLPRVIEGTDARLADVIVADNGSDDASGAYLDTLEAEGKIRTLRFPQNLGFARGYNEAVAALDYEYIALFNSDMYPEKGWDAAILDYFDRHSGTVAVQPKILSDADHSMFEYAGACGGFLDRDGYPYCRGRIFAHCEQDEGQYDAPMEVFWASGAAFVVKRQAYLDAGGLDPEFFAHMEEIDLCWRLRIAGGKIAVVPSARVYHLGGGSLPAGNPRKTYLNFRNNLLMMHKNLPRARRRGALLRRRLLDALAWCRFVAGLDFANAGAVWRAHRDYARMSASYPDEADSPDVLASMPQGRISILARHYLMGNKRYSDIF